MLFCFREGYALLKICTKCEEEKPATLEFFAKRDNGLRAACKICIKIQQKERYEENKEEILQRNKDYHKRNAEKVAEIRKNYYQENKDKMREWQKQYNEENKDAISKNKKAYRQNNLEIMIEKDRKYYAENKEKILKKHSVYMKENRERFRPKLRAYQNMRRKTNPQIRLADSMRSRLNQALRIIKKAVVESDLLITKIPKADSTFNLIGCDLYFLKEHLEKQFDENMTWANYGSYWHCDHIRPCASFDLTDPEQQRICFYWTNLQPLEAKENMSKGAKWSS